MRFIFILFLFILTGCSSTVNVVVEEVEEYVVYAKNNETFTVERVYVDYTINDYIDIFNLYTIYQNKIPFGYSSVINPNTKLIDQEINDEVVYYYVDNFIQLSDFELIDDTLIQTLRYYGYKNGHIIFNNQVII